MDNNKTQHNFKVIKGGLKFRDKNEIHSYIDTLEYKSGYAIDSFLHREMCMHIIWEDNSIKNDEFTLHEFIYFSYAENIFVNYVTDIGEDSEEISILEFPLLDNLGAAKIPISEGIAKYLFGDFIANYQSDTTPMYYEKADSDEEDELFSHITASPLNTENGKCSKEEFLDFLPKLCKKPKTPYGVINYFLMNFACGATDALDFLCEPAVDLNSNTLTANYRLHRNSIEKSNNGYFLCEALLISPEIQKVATFRFDIDLKALKVKSFNRVSDFKISPFEVSMILHRSEYVTVFNILSHDENLLANSLLPLTNGAQGIEYEYGNLFAVMDPELQYMDAPDFVSKDEFIGSIFLNEASQLILVSLNMENLLYLERAISYSPLSRALIPNGRYEFQEPTFYEYLYSDFVLFEEFVSFFDE
ncbi:MAG: hypothetical protein ACTTH0_01650 [Eubacteriales bacterium]